MKPMAYSRGVYTYYTGGKIQIVWRLVAFSVLSSSLWK